MNMSQEEVRMLRTTLAPENSHLSFSQAASLHYNRCTELYRSTYTDVLNMIPPDRSMQWQSWQQSQIEPIHQTVHHEFSGLWPMGDADIGTPPPCPVIPPLQSHWPTQVQDISTIEGALEELPPHEQSYALWPPLESPQIPFEGSIGTLDEIWQPEPPHHSPLLGNLSPKGPQNALIEEDWSEMLLQRSDSSDHDVAWPPSSPSIQSFPNDECNTESPSKSPWQLAVTKMLDEISMMKSGWWNSPRSGKQISQCRLASPRTRYFSSIAERSPDVELLSQIAKKFVKNIRLPTECEEALLTSICRVLIFAGVEKKFAYEILKKGVPGNGNSTLDKYVKGNEWMHEMLEDMYWLGLGLEAIELLPFCT